MTAHAIENFAIFMVPLCASAFCRIPLAVLLATLNAGLPTDAFFEPPAPQRGAP
jgi:hypothetical protein